jgi:hypothetical protein
VLNAGEVANKGVELLVRANPLRSTTGLNWDLTINWSKNTSEVTELYPGIETLRLGGQWSVNTEARVGEPYGALYGNPVLRCGVTEDTQYATICEGNDGLPILNESGNRQQDPVRRVLGNYNPDWIGGIQNRFSWGSWDLSFLFQGQYGGDIYSVTDMFGKYAGVLTSSLEGREVDQRRQLLLDRSEPLALGEVRQHRSRDGLRRDQRAGPRVRPAPEHEELRLLALVVVTAQNEKGD